ncbi:MAG TPA: DUF3887 domain-containing protein [Bellilinea sp.]|jgi:hypothetical protein|nr:DUF3887 domain-containing protein [Bellilinea sp.]
MHGNRTFIGLTLLLLTGLLLGACSVAQAPLTDTTVLEGDQANAAYETVKTAAENVVTGLVNADYSTFSKDFSAEVAKGMDENAFNDLLTTFQTDLGSITSSELTAVLQDDQYTTLVYTFSFEKNGSVVMRVVFDRGDSDTVTGIWFDSPVLIK